MPIGRRGDWLQASRNVSTRVWRSAARRYASRLGRFVATASLFGAAVDTVGNIITGTKRALDSSFTPSSKMPRIISDPNVGGYNQRKKAKAYAGKVLSTKSKQSKILGAHFMKHVVRFNGAANTILEPSESFPGYFPLDYFSDGNPQADGLFPYYLMDLTCAQINNQRGLNGTFNVWRSCPLTRLIQRNGTNTFSYAPIAGRNADNGADTFDWLDEYTPLHPSAVPVVRDKNFYEWIDIRMNLYGASKVPTRIFVQLVQFMEEELVPLTFAKPNLDPPEPVSTIPDDPEQYARWQNHHIQEIDKLVGNPIAIRGFQPRSKPYRVLFSRQFNFEPQMTTEEDKTPHQVEFYFKYNMNKCVWYTENPSHDQLSSSEIPGPNEWIQNTQFKNSCFCAPKGRVFLKITGQTPKNIFTMVEGERPCDYAPSFDLIVRRRSTFLGRE